MLNGPIAHMNFARLLHPAGDARVAGFIDAVTQVNQIAERSPGFIWRLVDGSSRTEGSGDYERIDADPLIAASLSVWESPLDLLSFVQKTLHGAFLRRRAEWFQLTQGPNYVIWPVAAAARPTMPQAWNKLGALAENGASAGAYDFAYYQAHGPAAEDQP